MSICNMKGKASVTLIQDGLTEYHIKCVPHVNLQHIQSYQACAYMCVCMLYTCVCMRMYVHACVYVYACVCMHVCVVWYGMCTCMRVYVLHTCVCMRVYTCICACVYGGEEK